MSKSCDELLHFWAVHLGIQTDQFSYPSPLYGRVPSQLGQVRGLTSGLLPQVKSLYISDDKALIEDDIF